MAASKEVIAARLVALRELHRPPLNQRQAAELIGVDPRTYGRWENLNDPTIPYLSSIEKIAGAFEIDPQEIMGNGDSPFDLRLERIELLLRRLLREQGLDPDESLEEEAARIADDAGRALREGQSETARRAQAS